jgi:hypothetical protein
MKLSWLIYLGYEVSHRKSRRKGFFNLTFLNPLAVKRGFELHLMGDSEHYFDISIQLLLAKTER